MADQTITTDTNHDAATGRAAGENFTLQQGATLTIDSCPHLTTMGILGDITMTAGTVHIDGRYVKEVAYSSGSGSLPTAIPTSITWDSGSSTGKIIRYDSGDYSSGVMTITVQTGTLEAADTITDGSWSATVDSVAVGFLVVFGEDQDWGAVDAQSTLRIQGDWYEVGVGDGGDDQTVTLPHTGHQHAVWVETGSGTGVYQIWHRVASDGASTIFYNDISQFGNTFESGFVFKQTIGSATLTFGDSTNGGVPPSGAKIRIPNVHIGTTTTGAPTTEVNLSTTATGVNLVAPNVNLNVEIDHLNGSTCVLDFRGTNAVTVSDTCWCYATTALTINKVNATVSWDNVALVYPSTNTTGSVIPTVQYEITDNVGGVTINDSLIYGGTNASNVAALYLLTMANIDLTGTCKLVSNQQDENSMGTLRGSVAVNVTAETLISLGGPVAAIAGCNNWTIDNLIFGLPPGRGTTEQNISFINLVSTQSVRVNGGSKATGGSKCGTGAFALLTDTTDTWIQNFGAVDAKIDGDGTLTAVISCVGITSYGTFKRIYFDTLNSTAPFGMLNSAANLLYENCSSDYNDEIELDANRVLTKGVHGGSGGPGSGTGIEDDLVNCIGTCFYDVFTSDTTGFVGLVFNDRGNFHLADVTITAGTPFWNGLGDLCMYTNGDQVVYEWPYWIKGHTAFVNTDPSKIGVTPTNIDAEYALDTGSGYGSWTSATGANLSGESIGPTGFKIKIRLTANTSASSNVRGFAIYTSTTISDQKNNLYPLSTVSVKVTAKDAASDAAIEGARVLLYASTGSSVTITRSSSTATVSHTTHGYVTGQKVVILGAEQGEYNGTKTITYIDANSYSYTVSGTPTTPATGTITSHKCVLDGDTNVSGYLEESAYEYSSDLAVVGRARKGTSTPYYKNSPISGTVTDAGLEITSYLVSDE